MTPRDQKRRYDAHGETVGLHQVLFLGEEERQVEHQRDLGELQRLRRERSHGQPALAAAYGRADERAQALVLMVPSSRLQDQFSQLLKPQNGNVQHGTKRNDTLQGGKGNDQLYGYAGNDVLNGGDGNDYLDGGVGNDTLRGGRGNDTLQGGAGDDLMVDNSGSNTFRGGEGTDTIRLSGKFSDYTITALGNNGIMPAIYPPRPVETGFQLVDKRTGETQTVYSTENFKFADMSLDAKALGSKIDSPRQDLQANQQKWQQANIDSYSS